MRRFAYSGLPVNSSSIILYRYTRSGINRFGCHCCSWSAKQGNIFFPSPHSRLRIWSRRLIRPLRPALARSFSTLRLNLVLTRGIPPISSTASNHTTVSNEIRKKKVSREIVLHSTSYMESTTHCRQITWGNCRSAQNIIKYGYWRVLLVFFNKTNICGIHAVVAGVV